MTLCKKDWKINMETGENCYIFIQKFLHQFNINIYKIVRYIAMVFPFLN